MLLTFLLVLFGGCNGFIGFSTNANNCSTIICESDGTCKPISVSKEQQCTYIDCCCGNTIGDGFFDYLFFAYCSNNNMIAVILILIICLIYSFLILAMLCEQYFVALMQEFVIYFNLAHNVAGVTFLAWGNGAAHVATSVAAFAHGGEQIKLAIGALIGATMFDTQFICATIAIVCNNTDIARRPLIRDCLYLIVTVFILMIVCLNGSIQIYGSIGILVMYILYIILVYVSSKIRQCLIKKEEAVVAKTTVRRLLESTMTETTKQFTDIMDNEEKRKSFSRVVSKSKKETMFVLKKATNKYKIFSYLSLIFLIPLIIAGMLFKLTIQISNRRNWNDLGALITCITGPLLIVFAFRLYDYHNFYWLLLPIIGFMISIYVFYKIKTKQLQSLSSLLIEKQDDYGTITEMSSIQKMHLDDDDDDDIDDIDDIDIDEKDNKNILVIRKDDNINDTLQHSLTADLNDKFQHSLHTVDVNDIESEELFNKNRIHQPSTEPPHYEFGYDGIISNIESISLTDFEKELSIQPVLAPFFLFLNFIVIVSWIKIVAEELVSIFTVLGVISSIDLTLLGLTLVTWGNAVPEFINNVSVAKKGYSTMAIAASIGGASMDINIGVGIGTLIGVLRESNLLFLLPNTANIFIGCIGTMFGCVLYVFIVACSGWKLNRIFASSGYTYYGLFILTNILIYYNIITLDILDFDDE